MRSLFLKIFLSYWVAQALFLVLAILITMAVRERGETATWDAQQANVLSKSVQLFEQGGPGEVRRYFDEVRESQHVRAYLLDEHGKEVSGRELPLWAESLAKGVTPPRRDFWQRVTPSPFRRQVMVAGSGRRYALIAFLPPNGPFGPGGVPGLSILIGIISSGLVCYLLARYLTSPVVRLRAATRRLAAGDLSARAGGLTARRRDEMAQLVRDFDTMAERLEESVNAQARLLTDISHELRSPLARLNVASALAHQRAGVEAYSALERIDLEADRLNDLIGGRLTIARLESGNDLRQKSPVFLGELIEEIVADADFEGQGRNCGVKSVIKDDCIVMGASNLLHSAIENVVRNATRYTQEGTNAEVSLERGQGAKGAEAVIRIVDSGPGAPEEALDKLFRPFYRIDDARGRPTGGAGLGLAITDRAVRLHGGTVKASNRPGGGMQVEIRLPLASGAGQNPSIENETAHDSQPARQSDPVGISSNRAK
ncbi:MAG TPA: ATP-binding protein [Terriglobales bacterium]|nr:ATP-binding protein [Terriglobales bacterium]